MECAREMQEKTDQQHFYRLLSPTKTLGGRFVPKERHEIDRDVKEAEDLMYRAKIITRFGQIERNFYLFDGKRMLKDNFCKYPLFLHYCKTNDIDNMMRIYNMGCIDLTKYNNEPFRISCYSGYIDVAKWIYSKMVEQLTKKTAEEIKIKKTIIDKKTSEIEKINTQITKITECFGDKEHIRKNEELINHLVNTVIKDLNYDYYVGQYEKQFDKITKKIKCEPYMISHIPHMAWMLYELTINWAHHEEINEITQSAPKKTKYNIDFNPTLKSKDIYVSMLEYKSKHMSGYTYDHTEINQKIKDLRNENEIIKKKILMEEIYVLENEIKYITENPYVYNIRENNDDLFKKVCFYDHTKIVEWFISLCPKYCPVVEGRTIVRYTISD